MYQYTKNTVSRQDYEQLEHVNRTDTPTHTDRRDRTHYQAALVGGKSEFSDADRSSQSDLGALVLSTGGADAEGVAASWGA